MEMTDERQSYVLSKHDKAEHADSYPKVGEYAYFSSRVDGSEVPYCIVTVEGNKKVACHYSKKNMENGIPYVTCSGKIIEINRKLLSNNYRRAA